MATYFAPHLTLKNVLAGMQFYERAFGAKELRRWSNDNGSVHVAEMEIDGSMFHIHEEVPHSKQMSPESVNCTTLQIEMYVEDPHAVVSRAEKAGGMVTSPVQDYNYGFRQGVVTDPFGHQWLIHCKI
jgi:PhnB protein